MIKICLLINLLLFTNFAFAGKETQNGAGLAEQNFSFGYKNLKTIIDLCWAHSAICLQTNEEKKILYSIRDHILSEYQSANQLQFESGTQNPNRFIIDGKIRIAVTGDSIGDPIYINTDLITVKDSLGKMQALDISMAVGILIHELGHHQGIKDHTFLDNIGAKVRSFMLLKTDLLKWDSFIEESMIMIPVPSIALTAIHSNKTFLDDKEGRETQIVVTDDIKLNDLNSFIDSQLYCPGDKKIKPIGYRLFQLAWEKTRSKMDNRLNTLTLYVQSGLSMNCPQPVNDFDLELSLVFILGRNTAQWELQLDKSKITIK